MQIFIYCRVTLHVSGVTADQATLEESSCTDIMTCTGGCGYSFSTTDDGCCDTRNM